MDHSAYIVEDSPALVVVIIIIIIIIIVRQCRPE
jgi:hypothetical protein